jgi:hypothetical protein
MEETFRLKTPHVAKYLKDPLGKKKIFILATYFMRR